MKKNILAILLFNAILFSDAQSYINTEDLELGDRFMLPDGSVQVVSQIERTSQRASVYNFTVDKLHNYYVSPTGVLVHNANCPHLSKSEVGNLEDITLKTIDNQPGGRMHNPVKNGRYAQDGEFDVVILKDGKVVLGEGHSAITGDAPVVKFAGRVKIQNGKIVHMTNDSGHYRPTWGQARKALGAMRRSGVPMGNMVTLEEVARRGGDLNAPLRKEVFR